MYNDYYLQQINTNLEEIIDNQESIINNEATITINQQTLISGDRDIQEELQKIQGLNAIIVIAIIWYIIYEFIGRCMKN